MEYLSTYEKEAVQLLKSLIETPLFLQKKPIQPSALRHGLNKKESPTKRMGTIDMPLTSILILKNPACY